MPKFSKELEFAKKTALGAGKIVQQHYQKALLGGYGYKLKGPRDIVTIADTESEKYIVEAIRKEFPDDAVFAEEGSGYDAPTTRKWLVDPLDATDNFIEGVPWFAVSIALEINGETQCGVVYNPISGALYYSEVDKGAYLNGAKISAKSDNKYPDIFVVLQMSKKKEQKREQGLGYFSLYFRKALRATNHDCMPLDFCRVASGRVDLMVGNGGWPWDFAAGILIAKEAGAIVSNAQEKPLNIYERGEKLGYVVAANQEIHKKALEDIRAFF